MGLDKWNKVYGNRDIEFGIRVKGCKGYGIMDMG